MESLRELFKPHLGLSRPRLSCFLMLVLAVIGQRTVSLVWLSQHPDTGAKDSSVYRRFQRFFAGCSLRAKTVGKMILSLAPEPSDGWILAMDRTNWKFGKSDVNILVVSVILGRVGLPIAWRVLPKRTKRGNSARNHRVALMADVLSILPAKKIRALTMDREFIGEGWLASLRLMEVNYIVRVKKNALIGDRSASSMCWRNRWKKWSNELHVVFGQEVYFAAKRIKKGRDSHVAVISNAFSGAEALDIYQLRWGIETLFSHLKKRGYQFEDTHMTKKDRIARLMCVLTVAFALCYRWGEKLEKETGIKLKNHGYRAKSLFRKGFESLHRMLAKPSRYAARLAEFFEDIIRRPLLEGNFVV